MPSIFDFPPSTPPGGQGIFPGEWDWQSAWGRDPYGRVAGIPQQTKAPGGFLTAMGGPQGLLYLGTSLLANQRMSPGEALGASFQQTQQMRRQQEKDALSSEYMRAQIEAMSRPERPTTPQSVQEYEYAVSNGFKGSFEDWRRASQGASSPTGMLQEYEAAKQTGFKGSYFDFLSRRSETTRTPPAPTVVNIGGVPSIVDRAAPGGRVNPLSTPEAEAAAKQRDAGATAAGRIVGEAQATAATELPAVESNAEQTLKLLTELENHPGFGRAVGKSAVIPVIPGTDAADFVTRVEQVQGKTFLEAFQSLKGGGHITEIEGQKAEQAIARIKNRGVKESDYRQAIQDLREVVKNGVNRQRQRAGLPSLDSAPGTVGETMTIGGATVTRKK